MLEDLINIGLSDYEAKAYLTLVNNGTITASEVSKKSSIPQGRVYNILGSLESKGFCSVFPGNVKKYQAISPEVAFSGILSKKKSEISHIEEVQTKLEEQYKQKSDEENPIDYIEVLTSKHSQVKRFDDLINASSSTLYSFNKGPYATGYSRTTEQIDNDSAPLKEIIKEGTEVKAIFEEDYTDPEAFIRMLEYYEKIGEHVRLAPKLPLKMLLSDGKTAMVSLRNRDITGFNLTSMVIDHTDLTQSMVELFTMYWEKSISIDEFKEKAKKHSLTI